MASATTLPAGRNSHQTLNEPRERAREARRQALLEAAEGVFAERGFSGATMSEIAARAGYSAGNLYNVFEGKEALFAEVLASRAGLILDLVRRALTSEGPLGQVVDRYVTATLELVEQHRGFFVMLTQANPDFDWHAAEADAGGHSLRNALEDQLERVFLDAMERGEIPRGDPRSHSSLLQGSLNAHVARWVRTGGTPEELWGPADDLRALIRRAFGLQPNP